MSDKQHPFAEWMSVASPTEKKELARRANTTVPALRQAAFAYRTGGEINLSAEFAGRLADAFKSMDVNIRREHLSAACADCPYAKHCKKIK